jgi:FtsH-binding integral membrane protein
MPSSPEQTKLRSFTLLLCGVLTLVWAGLSLAGLLEKLPGHYGYGTLAAAVLTVVYAIIVLPALLLAYFNRLIGVAFALAVLGLVCYAYDPILRLTALLGN